MLQTESGLMLESPNMGFLREFVLNGDYNQLESVVDKLELNQRHEKQFRFLIRKQKFLENIELNNYEKCLHILQMELEPLKINTAELHKLAKYLFLTRLVVHPKISTNSSLAESRARLLESLIGNSIFNKNFYRLLFAFRPTD